MSNRGESAVSWLLTVAALAIAGVLVHREFFAPKPPWLDFPDPDAPPSYIEEWRELNTEGVAVGDANAPVVIVEFTDLECPFCRSFHETLQATRKEWGEKIAVRFVHFPLPIHRNAYAAAKAAECAQEEGRFEQFIDAAFAKQDSLGIKPWLEYASLAGIADTANFGTCFADTSRVERVERGRALGALLKVKGTPTVIVNGWRFPTTPSDSTFRRVVRDIIDGKTPF